MSTVRIQVRRGTSSEWTTANPILAAGEMGVETNTNKFKFGNGTDSWTALSYAAADAPAIGEISQDAINTALSMGAGLSKTYDDGANTITINVDTDTIATVAYVDSAVNAVGNSLTDYIPVSDRGVANGVASLNSSGKVPESELDLHQIGLNIATGGSISGASISTPELVATDITSGGQIDANNVVISGNLTVTGTTTTVNTTNLSVTDPIIQVASDNAANTVDVGFVGHYNDGTSQHTGLVRDSSESKWKLFTGVTSSPTTNVDFTQGSLDALAVGAFEASSASIGNVSNTELQYLNGVASPIQTQINDIITDLGLYAPQSGPTISNATFTGTLTLPNDSIETADLAPNAVTNAKIADQAVNNAKIASDAAIAQTKIAGLAESFAEKAPLASPTFTGSVVLPSTTSIGDVTSTELGYLDGVTSSIQTQITAAGTALSNHESDTTNIHGIADTSLLATTANVATAKTEAIAAAGTAADTKVSTAVAALTKSSVGLGNVDNTSDADKPVSTAQAAAIATAKSEAIADATSQVNAVIASAPAALNTLDELAAALGDDANFASTVTTSLAAKAPLASPTFTGTVTVSASGVAFTDGTQTKEGVPSRTPIVQKTASYTLSDLTERDSMIEVGSSSATTITIPANSAVAYPVGTSIDILQTSTGQVTIAGAAGVTVNATPGLKLRTQWSGATLFKRATDTWVVYGDLSA
jgi:hypothetical protein